MRIRTTSLLAFLAAFALAAGPVATALAQDDFDEGFDEGDSFGEEDSSEGSSSAVDEHIASEESGGGGGDGLMLTKGTMQAGGSITIGFDRAIPEEGDSVGGGNFTFAPQAGYFIIDNLELLADLGFVIPFGDLHEFDSKQIFFDVGARYIFDFDAICVYAGALFGMNFEIVDMEIDDDDSESQTWPSIVLSIPAGILVPLNQHVALDVGMRFNFNIGVGDTPFHYLDVPIGYFGVEGFFNFLN